MYGPSHAKQRTQLTALTRERYVTIFTKIALALLEADEREDPEASLDECRQLANEAWDGDAKGAETLPKHKWLDSLFELADTWTVGIEAHEYAKFLASLFHRTAEREKRTRAIVFRPDDKVEAMPPQGEEEEEEEEEEGGGGGGSGDQPEPVKGRGRAGRDTGTQRGVSKERRDGGGGGKAGSRSRTERDALQAKRREGR